MFPAVQVDPANRNVPLGPTKEIEVGAVKLIAVRIQYVFVEFQGWTAFDFPGRGNQVFSAA